MHNICVLGAGYMGSAITFPLSENGHDVRLWGTWLDDDLIDACRKKLPHPKLQTELPDKVRTFLEKISGILEKGFSEKDFYKFIEMEFLTQSENITQRAKQIKGLYLQGYLHNRTYSLYNEAINCYLYGFYNASCVLCRTISELIAKRYIQHRGDGDLLCGTEKDKKQYTIPGLLSKLSVPKEILQLYRSIHTKADKVIHEIDEKTSQEEVLKTIKELQEFIKNFPKCI